MEPDEVRRGWAEREGEYSPAYYAYYGPNETSELVRETLARRVGTDAGVLEVGCSSGRHLAHLHANGFDDLAGVEINEAALSVMDEEYPDLAAAGRFHVGPMEEVLAAFPPGRFDAVYTVETLQHVHPDSAAAFDELARVTGDLLLTVESDPEGGLSGDPTSDGTDPAVNYVDDGIPLYYRDWERVFTDRGLELVEVAETDRNTARTFRHLED